MTDLEMILLMGILILSVVACILFVLWRGAHHGFNRVSRELDELSDQVRDLLKETIEELEVAKETEKWINIDSLITYYKGFFDQASGK